MTDRPELSALNLDELAARQGFDALAAVCFHIAALAQDSRGGSASQAGGAKGVAKQAIGHLIEAAEHHEHALAHAWSLARSPEGDSSWWELWGRDDAPRVVPLLVGAWSADTTEGSKELATALAGLPLNSLIDLFQSSEVSDAPEIAAELPLEQHLSLDVAKAVSGAATM